MKRVLIISYNFNKKESIGSIRMRGLAKYLPKYQWEPTILTTRTNIETDHYSDSNIKIVEIEHSDVVEIWKSKIGLKADKTIKNQLNIKTKKNNKVLMDFLLYWWEEIFAFPDFGKNWYKPAVNAGDKLLKNEHFDAVISSCQPPTVHLVANELKKRHEIPWIADFRDLWTENPYHEHSCIRKYFEKRLELKTLKDADWLTTVSKPLENDLKKLHQKDNVTTIFNGFDPDMESKLSNVKNDKLSILYTGNLYNGKRDPEKLFKALNELKNEGKININDFYIDFYGTIENWLHDDVKKYNLDSVVKINGMISHDESIKKQRQAQILLLLTWDDPKEFGTTTGKIFEYIAAKRPILSIGPSQGVVKEIIQTTNTGVHLSDLTEIKDQIYSYYKEYKKNGSLHHNGFPKEIEKYSHIGMAKKFAFILNKATNS